MLVSALKQFDPQIDFRQVFDSLDCDDFFLSSQQAFGFLNQVWTEASLEGTLGSIICKPWTNQRTFSDLLLTVDGKSQFIRYALHYPTNVFSSLPRSSFIVSPIHISN